LKNKPGIGHSFFPNQFSFSRTSLPLPAATYAPADHTDHMP
jgi:hypothetical protein